MRKLSTIETIESEFVHSPFYGEEIRGNDGISAEVKIGNKWESTTVWKYSPFGVELLPPTGMSLEVGTNIDLKIKFHSDEILFESVKVANVSDDKNRSIAAVRLFLKKQHSPTSINRRKSIRWVCPESLLPTGTCPNPLKFNDHIIFRVEDISAGGLRLVTSMRNKLVYVGQQLETSISLPLVGNVSVPLIIKFVDVQEKNDGLQHLVLGTAFSKVDPLVQRCLAEYLLNFGQDVTVSSLKKDGFPAPLDTRTFDFSYVKNKEDYDQVLSLRKRAYIAAGKVKENTDQDHFMDVYDSRSRILIVKKNEVVVGSVRVMFHTGFADSELFADGISGISDIEETAAVEASRLCTDPEFRGLDIAYQLVSHMYLTAIKSGYRYMYGGATGSMIDFYRDLGWKISNTSYSCTSLKGIPHKVVSIDLHEAVLGRKISGKTWNRVYRPLFEYLSERQIVNPTPMDLVRLRLRSMLPSGWQRNS